MSTPIGAKKPKWIISLEKTITSTAKKITDEYFGVDISNKSRRWSDSFEPRAVYTIACVYAYGNKTILGQAMVELGKNRSNGYNIWKKRSVYLSDKRLNKAFHEIFKKLSEEVSSIHGIDEVSKDIVFEVPEIPNYNLLEKKYKQLTLQSIKQKTLLLKAVAMAKRHKEIDRILHEDCMLYQNLGTDSTKRERELAKAQSKRNYRKIKEIDNELGAFLLKTLDE